MKFTDLPIVTDTFGIAYRDFAGLFFHANTSPDVVTVIYTAWIREQRLAIAYGDVNTGKAWSDVELGRIGRSTGRIKIPLVIYNSRSMGGGAILDHCIVKIMLSARPHTVLYQHPCFFVEEPTKHIIWQITKRMEK